VQHPERRKELKFKYPKLTDLDGYMYDYKSKMLNEMKIPTLAYLHCQESDCPGRVSVDLLAKSFEVYVKHNHLPKKQEVGYGTPLKQTDIVSKEAIMTRITQITQKQPTQAPYEVQAILHEELRGKNAMMPTTKEIQMKMRYIRQELQIDSREQLKVLEKQEK
jgi:hypothetical protein